MLHQATAVLVGSYHGTAVRRHSAATLAVCYKAQSLTRDLCSNLGANRSGVEHSMNTGKIENPLCVLRVSEDAQSTSSVRQTESEYVWELENIPQCLPSSCRDRWWWRRRIGMVWGVLVGCIAPVFVTAWASWSGEPGFVAPAVLPDLPGLAGFARGTQKVSSRTASLSGDGTCG